MAECQPPQQGYQCEFIDPVPGNLKCHKCQMVARNLVFISCCMESYCHDCFSNVQQEDEPCPACGKKEFSFVNPGKYLKQIQELRVHCSMKGRGCDWSGTLGEWETHMDPDLDNCQFADTKCPLNCDLRIPKNQIDYHVSKECTNRDYNCQHCNFEGTYGEVVDVHLPQCKHVPVQCPNFCGVTCDREHLWQHMKTCSLEEVVCQFSGVGCEDKFLREKEGEHMEQKRQSHLAKTAAKLVKVNQELQKKILEQEEKIKNQDAVLIEQEKKISQQQSAFDNVDNRLEELEDRLFKQVDDYQNNLRHQKHKEQQYDSLLPPDLSTDENEKDAESPVSSAKPRADSLNQSMTQSVSASKEFTLKEFSKVKEKELDWKSAPMYTHSSGYKFCIGIDANGRYNYRGKAIRIELNIMKGEFDDLLLWPRSAEFTIELINQQGGPNLVYTSKKITLRRAASDILYVGSFQRVLYDGYYGFLEHGKLKDYLNNDELHFRIRKVNFP